MTVTLLATGSPDPRHEQEVRLLAGRLKVAGTPTGVAFLDHNDPDPARAAAQLVHDGTDQTRVVPLFIAASWRLRTDVSAAVQTLEQEAPGVEVQACAPLGVHPLLLAGVGELVNQLDLGPAAARTGLILTSAGMRDPRTRRALDSLCDSHGPLLAAALGLAAVRMAHLDAGRPIWPVRTLLHHIDGCANTLVVPLTLTAGPVRDRVVHAAHRVDLPVVPGSLAQTRAAADLVTLRISDSPRTTHVRTLQRLQSS